MRVTGIGVIVSILMTVSGAAVHGQSNGSPVTVRDFTGSWQIVSDDGTQATVLELEAQGNQLTGSMTDIERGYFSGRQTITLQLAIQGSLQGGKLTATLSDPSASRPATEVMFIRRGEYLVMRSPGGEHGFARPGRSLVQSAAGSTEAATLARSIQGHVYATASQASGRGAFVGGRLRVAFCAGGRIEYDESDLASTPGAVPGQGGGFGSTMSRRGEWSVVLLAGAPVILAQWEGTGTSYSLTRYLRVQPGAGGGATIDGTAVRASGTC